MLRKLMFAVMALAISLFSTLPVSAQSSADENSPAGAVYIMNNAASGNQVLKYNRASNGSLTYVGSFATGGLGSGLGITVPPDPLGSQKSLIVSADGKWVFAVNAGSNEISAFQVTVDGLRLTSKVSSGGSYPVSLTYQKGILYALNAAGDGSIAGFSLDSKGRLHVLENSIRSLQANTPPDGAQPNILEAPAQVAFSPDGDFLLVTDKGGVSGVGRILVFTVSNDRPSAQPAITLTQGAVPFDLAFDAALHPVVVDASTGSVTAYQIHADGSLAILDVEHTSQAATCWVAATPNGKWIFTDNTGSGTLSGFRTSPTGQLTPLNGSSIVATTGPGTLPLDIGISANGKFVYSLETGAGQIGAFQISADGSLTSLGAQASYPAISGFQGIAVY
jgi:6-phosphogluconolactonase (cycloisomerase 2 family)